MNTTNLIYSDSREIGQWLDVDFTESEMSVNLEELFYLYRGTWTIRNVAGRTQVLCFSEQCPENVLQEIEQFLADISLRERISKRCTVQANTLVKDVLCHLMKNKI